MASAYSFGRRTLATVAGLSAAALALAACVSTNDPGDDGSNGNGDKTTVDTITIGTTERITSMDPAGSYDNGSFTAMLQVYPFLVNAPYGTADVQPDIAVSAEFTSPTEYTVKLKPGLTFANGNALTSSDVKFSFERQVAIASDQGPSWLLYNLDSIATPDDVTVIFTLKSANDQIWPQILSSPAAPIVDEEVFSATAVTSDADIMKGRPFAGQYTIESYDINNLVSYKANPGYQGLLGPAKTENVHVKYYADSSNLKLDIQQGNIDVANRTLSATDIADLRTRSGVQVVDGPGGEIRYLVFNFALQPFGTESANPDAAKALAVRQAIAHLIDRNQISEQVYRGTFQPLYSYVPTGQFGATESLKQQYGDGNGNPDPAKAAAVLQAAGVETPLALHIQYVAERYGPSSGDEYAAIKDALETSGLFTVTLQSTEWVTYSQDRTSKYPIFQLGWFPDYSDPDTYLSPFFAIDNFLVNGYVNEQVDSLIRQQPVTTDKGQREAMIRQIQDLVAQDLSTIPYMQGAQVAVVLDGVSGVSDTLDGSFKFRYGAITKTK